MIGFLDPATELALVIGVMVGALILLGSAVFSSARSGRYARRLRSVTDRKELSASGVAGQGARAQAARTLTRRGSATPGIDRIFRLLPRREILMERLSRTGRTISVGQYMIVTLAIIGILTLAIVIFVHIGLLPSLLLGTAFGVLFPHYFIGRMGRRRTFLFLNLFPEAIDLMVRALRAGLPISEAIVTAGQEIGDPVGTEFRSIEAGMRLGRDLDSLLWDISKRIPAPEFRFFIIALNVQRETGGNLAETLNNLSDVLRRRRAMRAKARAMASEARASTAILGSLPVLVTVILSITSPTYIMPLFTDIRGLMLVGVALGMLAFGILIMVKMARFEI
ncbi:MAG TPA: type II secretion system F family protein [Stellaceae bacterium]|jgi:tight adherence protein B|nr:type II secretion system F family protein [Stellaceae bacterium]